MLLKNILVIFAANLAAGSAIGTSPQVIDLDATALIQGNGCAAAGVVKGQYGRYYRATGCKNQIGAVDPGVCIPLQYPQLSSSCVDSRHRSVAGRATNPTMRSKASAPLVTVPMASTVTFSMMTTTRTRLVRPGTRSLVAGNAIRRRRAGLVTVSCAGTSAKRLFKLSYLGKGCCLDCFCGLP